MKNVEIERKFLIRKSDIPFNYKKYRHIHIEQKFISLSPCIRIRKANEKYYLTVKSKPAAKIKSLVKDIKKDMLRSEYEISIEKNAYNRLSKLTSGRTIKKTRYFIPYKKHIIELDVFEGDFKGLIYAEIEFKNLNIAKNLIIPEWFYKEVTGINKYKNTSLSICTNVANLIK